MNCFDIINKFLNEKHKSIKYLDYRKVWFEIYICEDYGTYASKTKYKFKKMYLGNNGKSIVLTNEKGKVIKELNKDNTVWINCITANCKYMEVRLVEYDCVEIEEVYIDEK